MTSSPDYSEYRKFLKLFSETLDPKDPLPLRVAGYTINDAELTGEIICWINQYLSSKNCPPTLIAPIIQNILESTRKTFSKEPQSYGYDYESNTYQPYKLMLKVIEQVNNICHRLLDNSKLDNIPPPPPPSKAPPQYASGAVKNKRRSMEDRHIVIDDLNCVFNIDSTERASYYAVFDGHAGIEAAAYAVSHLHCHLAANLKELESPVDAMRNAFRKTDTNFLQKCQNQKINSGTTAVCALYRPVEKRLYVGWLGDSKALLVSQGNIMQLVTPHKPDNPSERARIEEIGGVVMFWSGLHRVNGTLAISRAIGDLPHRPFISAEPDIVTVPLTGNEDFLILACDGLWDFVTEDDAAFYVYKRVRENPDNTELVTKSLIELAQLQGSPDNISVIVVFLRDPQDLSTSSWPSAVIPSPLDNMEAAYDNSNCTTTFNNANQDAFQKTNFHHDDKINTDVYGVEDDFGPETDVDVVDEAMIHSPSLTASTKDNNVPIDFNLKASTTDIITNNETIQLLDNNHHNNIIKNDLIKEQDIIDVTNDFHLNNHNHNNHHQIDDNKLYEATGGIVDDALTELNSNNSELIQQHSTKKEIDFSEKREYSFECEEYEKELNTLSDATVELMSTVSDALSDPLATPVLTTEIEPIGEVDLIEPNYDNNLTVAPEETEDPLHITTKQFVDDFMSPSSPPPPQHNIAATSATTVVADYAELLSAAAAENADHHIQTENNIEFDSETDVANDAVEHDILINPTSAENVVVPDSGEESEDEWNYINVKKTTEESNVIAQNIVDSQEACLNLLKQEEDQDDPELLHVEQLKIEGEQILGDNIANKTINNIDIDDQNAIEDDDDMASQLNPDAKVFVPTSPVRSAPLSPFGNNNGVGNNGGLLHAEHLLVNDRILAQSPRKNGSTPMDIIDVPSEDEFDNEISKRPADIHDGDNLDNSFTEYKRPESSSSQCSEQEQLNPKEAMNIDEKQQEYEMDSGNNVITPSAPPTDDHFIVSPGVSDAVALTNGDVTTPTDAGNANANYIDLLTQSHREQDPMSVSFYNDGTEAATNPFVVPPFVDLNAVHVLPDFIDSDAADANRENSNLPLDDFEQQLKNDVADEISKPEDDQYTPSSETKHFDTQFESMNNESDVPESELLIETQPQQQFEINVVTSTLNNLALSDAATISPQFEAEDFVENIKNQCNDKYIDSGLSPNANEFNPFINDVSSTTNDNVIDLMDNIGQEDIAKKSIDDSAESDSYLHDNSNQIIAIDDSINVTESAAPAAVPFEVDDREAAAESDVCMNNITEAQLISMPEPSQPDLVVLPTDPIEEETEKAVAVETPIIESLQKFEIESIPEPIATDLKEESSVTAPAVPEVSAEDAAKAAAAVAAAAAIVAATTTAAVAPAKKTVSQTKTVTAKKTDIKPIKSAPIVAAKKSTTSAPKSAPSTKSAVKSTTVAATVEKIPPPIARPRTTAGTSAAAVAPKTATVEKKATAATTTKKPISNGELKSNRTVLKKTAATAEAPPKPASLSSQSSSSQSTTVTKTTTTARSTMITKSAPSKPTTILVTRPGATTKAPSSARSTQLSTAHAKPATITLSSTVPTKPKTITVSATARTSSSTARPLTSPSKPIADKTAKETTNKSLSARTSNGTSSAKSATAKSSGTGIFASKKSDTTKPATITIKPTTKSAPLTTTTKKPLTNGQSSATSVTTTTPTSSTSVSSTKKPTTMATRVSLAPAAKKASPLKKATPTTTGTAKTNVTKSSIKPIVETKKIIENGKNENVDNSLHEKPIDTNLLTEENNEIVADKMGPTSFGDNNLLLMDMNNGSSDQAPVAIIDSSAD